MKKLGKLVLLILVLSAILVTAVACKNNEPTLSVKEDAMPQLVHVLGEELDLSKGVLLVTTGKNTEEVAMNAEGVSVSGYDKTKLGEQTVTISYGDASTTLTVNVVERMQIVDYTTDYLVGDAFDRTAGRLRITRNDGTTFTVILNNQDVSIEDFDSTAAGTGLSVKAKYTSGTETYETTFPVNVHDVDTVTLHAPNKKAYNSHEKDLVLDGGYLTLSGNNGALKKDIKLTADGVSISGFDLGAVKAENTPLTQRIFVTYKDQPAEYYDIKITYTSVSTFNDNVSKFASLDWSGTTPPTVSKELGTLALELMDLYTDLSKADAVLISTEDLLSVARAAVSYGYNLWVEDLNEFEGAFSYEYDPYSYSYGLFMACESYEAVEHALEALKVTDRPIYKVYNQITKILAIEEIADELSKYVTTPMSGETLFSDMIPIFEVMLEFYDDYLPLIPATWQTSGTAAYADEIETVYTYMANSGYIGTSNAWIFEQAAAWREDDADIKTFDALYTYYYNQEDAEALTMLAYAVLPSAFDELIDRIDGLLAELESIGNYYMYDTTEFFYDYYNLIDLAYEYATHPDEMVQFCYLYLPVNAVYGYDSESVLTFDSIIEYIYLGGYVQLSSALIELDTYHNLMDTYMDVYGMSLEDADYLANAEYGEKVETMLQLFLSLSAPQQNMFLNSLMPYYVYGYYSFSYDEELDGFASAFNALINEYYMSKLASEDAKAAYLDLIIANEIYSLRFAVESWHDDFETKMQDFEQKYILLSTDEQAVFDSYFSTLKTNCNSVRTTFADGEPTTELGDWKAMFDELYTAIGVMNDVSYIIDGGELDAEGYYFYNVFFAAYERAVSIANTIINTAPQDIVEAYYTELLYVVEYTSDYSDDVQTVEYTYDYVLSLYRSNYMLYIIDEVGGLDVYKEMGFVEFFDAAYDLIIPYFNSVLYGMEELFVVDKDKALAIIDAFSQLTPEAKITHLLMEGGVYSTYYNAVDLFVTKTYSTAVKDVVFKIIDLEYAHIIYSFFMDDESLADVEDTLADLVDLYEGLEGDDKTNFDDFEELYAYYVELCEALLEAEPAN